MGSLDYILTLEATLKSQEENLTINGASALPRIGERIKIGENFYSVTNVLHTLPPEGQAYNPQVFARKIFENE